MRGLSGTTANLTTWSNEANKLSIGDWVCAKMTVINGEERLTPPMRVIAIGETWVQLRIDPEAGDPDEYDIEDIRPITLTADILERNGFEKTMETEHKIEFKFISGNAQRAIALRINTPNFPPFLHFGNSTWAAPHVYTRIKSSTVHELQHLLLLAGIEKEITL